MHYCFICGEQVYENDEEHGCDERPAPDPWDLVTRTTDVEESDEYRRTKSRKPIQRG